MSVLVTWGSKRGGTEEIARIVADTLQREGFDVDLLEPGEAIKAEGFDAAIVGGAVYMNRWHRDARRFVNRQERALRRVPVWFFSSGPLDSSAERQVPTGQVRTLMERVGAQGHVTFGGRLAPDASGFPAHAMAKAHAGDWRDPERIRAWAKEVAHRLPTARPGIPVAQPGRSWSRLLLHGLAGWAGCAAVMGAMLAIASLAIALTIHAIAAPLIFAAVSWHYFTKSGARDPLPTAFAFAAVVAFMDLVLVAGIIQRSLDMFTGFAGFWLPLVLLFAATWATGALMSTFPWPHAPAPPRAS